MFGKSSTIFGKPSARSAASATLLSSLFPSKVSVPDKLYKSEYEDSDSESDSEYALSQPEIGEYIPRKSKNKRERGAIEKAIKTAELTYGENLEHLNRVLGSLHSDMFNILDKCEQQIDPDKFSEEEYKTIVKSYDWRFPQLQIPSIKIQIASRLTRGEDLSALSRLLDEADSQAEYIDICHDTITALEWIVKLYTELELDSGEIEALVKTIKTSSGSFNPKKGHEELDKIIEKVIVALRKKNFQIIDFPPPFFIDKDEGLKTFGDKTITQARVGEIVTYHESGRKITHPQLTTREVLGTPIQAIDAGPGTVSAWIPRYKWFCHGLYGGVTYVIECLPEVKELLIVSWIRLPDHLYYHVFRSTGAISINEVIRILQEYFDIYDFDNGIRGIRNEDEEDVGSGNVTLIFAGTTPYGTTFQRETLTIQSSDETIFNIIKGIHGAAITERTKFDRIKELKNKHRIIACTLGLKTIGDRSSTDIIEHANIHIFGSVDEFLAKVLQILFSIGKLSKLPTIFIQKRGGFDVYEMPLDTQSELKQRFMRLMYWNKDNRGRIMFELIQKFGLDLLNTLCEITYRRLPPELSLWQRIEVEILKSINEEFKKRYNAFNNKMTSLRGKLKTALRQKNNQGVIDCLSQVPSQNELNPSAFIAELLGEENPFIDIDPSEQLNFLIEKRLLSRIPPELSIPKDIFKSSFYQKQKINIELELDTIFSKCLHIQMDGNINLDKEEFFARLRDSKLLKDKITINDSSEVWTGVLKLLFDRWRFFNSIFDDVAEEVKAEVETGESKKTTNSKASRAGDDISEIGSIYEFVDLGSTRGPMYIHIDDKYIHLNIKTPAGANDKNRLALGTKIKEAIEGSIYDENDILISEDGQYLTLPSSIELLLDIRTRFGHKQTTIVDKQTKLVTRVNVKEICNQAISKRLADLRGYQLMTDRQQSNIRRQLFLENAVSFGTCFPFCGKGGRKTRRIHKRITSKKNKRPARKTQRRRN